MEYMNGNVPGVGIIGLGYWGPNLVRNFYKQPSCQVVAICDLDGERLTRQQEIYPTVRTTKNSNELINSPDIDVVAICTPTVEAAYQSIQRMLASVYTNDYIIGPIPVLET